MSGIQPVSAPWALKGRSWVFVLPALSKTGSLPAGFSSPHEAEALASGGEFIGGLGTIQIVSYSESPVGPYDELIYAPGKWKYRDGSVGFRITRIYVSSKESTENGRRNWNIPKQQAEFNISYGKHDTTISVSHPGSSSPFFKASMKTIPVLSSLPVPFNTNLLGKYLNLIQPPIPAGEKIEEVGTAQWVALCPAFKGKARVVSFTPLLDGKSGDSVGFPAVIPWNVGISTEQLELTFPVPTPFDSL